MNTSLKSEALDRAFDGCTPFLTVVDRAIEEGEENLRKLKTIRSMVKSELLGENPVGLQKAMSAAGPAITPEQDKVLADTVEQSVQSQ